MTNISVLGLRLVKEESGRYDLPNKIESPLMAYHVFRDVLDMEERTEEIMAMITLDTKNKITGVFLISQGSLDTSIVHPREVFKRAIMQNSASIILGHNHPSGDPNPSKEDISITERLREAGIILGIRVTDHIIVGDTTYVSFKEIGIL